MTFSPTADDAPWARPWTVAEPLSFEGVGMHSGILAALRVLPAEAGTGFLFARVDLVGNPLVPGIASNVVETQLSTTLGHAGVTVQTTEHLLAALWGMGITDARLELDGPEVPIMDGSAAPFVSALEAAGAQALSGNRRIIVLGAHGLAEGDKTLTVAPDARCRVTIAIDFHHPHAGPQVFHGLLTPSAFSRAIAPARTFGFRRDVEALRSAGYARGGSLDNALVIDEDGPSTPWRFPDELARHKALDLVGDLALAGAHWHGHVVGVKAGHSLHTALARELARDYFPQARVQEVS